MPTSEYSINKGVNQPIRFKGLQAQYIGYFAAACIGLLLLFAALYFLGLNPYMTLAITGLLGVGMGTGIVRLSRRFGTHGLQKYRARRFVPTLLITRSRGVFIKLQFNADKRAR